MAAKPYIISFATKRYYAAPFWVAGSRQAAQPSGFNTRRVEAGSFSNLAAGRMGRGTRLPPQLGQTPFNFVSTQSAQKVHSYVQMRASLLSGGRSRSQHSQLGRNSSMAIVLLKMEAIMMASGGQCASIADRQCFFAKKNTDRAGGPTR